MNLKKTLCLLALAVVCMPLSAFANEDCHGEFAGYVAARPYIINPATSRANTTIVGVLEERGGIDGGDVSYRVEIRSANGELVYSRAAQGELKHGGDVELELNWNATDNKGANVADGEYTIELVGTLRHHKVAMHIDGDEPFAQVAQAKSSPVRVVVDRAGRYDSLFNQPQHRVASSATSIDSAFPYQFFFGTTHAHTSWSDGGMPVTDCASGRYGYAGGAVPTDAFAYAKTSGSVDFIGVVEHNHLMQDACTTCTEQQIKDRYHSGLTAAANATVAGSFVGLFGMEWGVISGGGHVNVYNQSQLMAWTGEPYDVLVTKSVYSELYTAIKNNQGTLGSYGSFCHPNSTDYNSFARTADGDAVMRGIAMISGPAFNTSTSFSPGGSTYEGLFTSALAQGWRLAPESHQDNHCWNYGNSTPNRTGALIPNGSVFNQQTLMAAYNARHIFASQDRNAQLVFGSSDYSHVMGDAFSASSLTVTAALNDPDGDGAQKIEIWGGAAGTNAAPGAAATVVASNTALKTLTAALTPQSGDWYYFAKIVEADGDTLWSAPMFVTWGGCSVPAATTLSAPSNGATGVATSTSLSWSAASGATSYDVYFGTTSSPALYQNTTSTSLAVSALSNSTTYYWRVVAKNACGSAASSATNSFTTVAACSLPSATTLSAPANGATGVATSTSLSWSAASGATSYDVYFGTTASPALYQNTTSTSLAVSALSNSTTYYWRVVAKNACGSAASSSTNSFTTVAACTLPSAATLGAPSNGATGVATSTTLSWSAASGATSYDVYFGTSASPALYQNTTATSLAVSALSNATTYYWRIVAKNACGSAASSGTNSFTTVTSGPVTLLNEGAESGATGWTFVKNTGSGWSIETSTDSHSGTHRFRTNAAYTTYLANADWSVVSPAFSLVGKTSATLTYYCKFSTESGYDYFSVEVSKDGGTTWTVVRKSSGASGGYPAWAAQGNINLSPYVGSATTKIRFRMTSDGSVQDWGAAVDDIVVTAQ